MKKITYEKSMDKELWFNWLTRTLNSYEALKDFSSGENPEDVAEKFLSVNRHAISKVFERFDEDDKETLEQFQKLTECEWHIYRILKKQIESRNKVINVNFRKEK